MFLYYKIYKQLQDKINELYQSVKDEYEFPDDIKFKLKIYQKALTYLNDLDSSHYLRFEEDSLDFDKLNKIKSLRKQINEGEYNTFYQLKNEMVEQNDLWFKLWYINYVINHDEFDKYEIDKQKDLYDRNIEIIGCINQNFIEDEGQKINNFYEYDLPIERLYDQDIFNLECLQKLPILKDITSDHFHILVKQWIYDLDNLDLKKEFKQIDKNLTKSNEL